jgi:hypothetical protein
VCNVLFVVSVHVYGWVWDIIAFLPSFDVEMMIMLAKKLKIALLPDLTE